MTQIFEKHTDDVIYMDADLADLYAGGLIRWDDVSGGGKTPSGHTWNKTAAARMEFTFFLDVAGSYRISAFMKTYGSESSVWISVDGSGDNTYQLVTDAGYQSWSSFLAPTIDLQAGFHKITVHSADDRIDLVRLAVHELGNYIMYQTATTFGPAAVTSGSAPVVDNETYADWLNDETRDPVRALLLELDYNGGTIRIGSEPYISNTHQAYDDGIMSDP